MDGLRDLGSRRRLPHPLKRITIQDASKRNILLRSAVRVLVYSSSTMFTTHIRALIQSFFTQQNLRMRYAIYRDKRRALTQQSLSLCRITLLSISLSAVGNVSLKGRLHRYDPRVYLICISTCLRFTPRNCAIGTFHCVLGHSLSYRLPHYLSTVLRRRSRQAPGALAVQRGHARARLPCSDVCCLRDSLHGVGICKSITRRPLYSCCNGLGRLPRTLFRGNFLQIKQDTIIGVGCVQRVDDCVIALHGKIGLNIDQGNCTRVHDACLR